MAVHPKRKGRRKNLIIGVTGEALRDRVKRSKRTEKKGDRYLTVQGG